MYKAIKIKRFSLALLLCLFLSGLGEAATLRHIRFAEYADKMRAVFDFDGEFSYHTQESQQRIEIFLPQAEAGPEIPSNLEINDLVVRFLSVEKDGEDLKVTIPLLEPVPYNIFVLTTPPRLVIDFDREFINVVYGGQAAAGLTCFTVKKGTTRGQIRANLLKVDLSQATVKPALARKPKDNALHDLISSLFPWSRKVYDEPHFFLDKLSSIITYHHAPAGINGTFFGQNGSPLGMLIIDGELISSPIYERSAFFLDENNAPYIDNVSLNSFFVLNGNKRYDINAVNQRRSTDEIILYTPVWGARTGTDDLGLELVIIEGAVSQINPGNSKIPDHGYVLSAGGAAGESLRENARPGQNISTHLKIIPYATSPRQIQQLVSGGPRLLKDGKVYVSKYQERFQPDVAVNKAARTALGINPRGELLLVTVDGPGKAKQSIGLTLEELAQLMLSLGAVDAVNLDGGSSSGMVINNQLVSGGFERSISNAIVALPRSPQKDF